MGRRHHYVSQFHLREFTDARVAPPATPFLWVGTLDSGAIERRAPKNVGWASDLFAGPGGLSARDASLESYIASEIESPAAFALRGWIAQRAGERGPIPAAVGRYIAWAAVRSLPMQALYQRWTDLTDIPEPSAQSAPVANNMESSDLPRRLHTMEHPKLGSRSDVAEDEIDDLRRMGWRFIVNRDDFLEFAHLQAWEFQSRQFPQLRWVVLDAPRERHFIIGDRPVVWGFQDFVDEPPGALQHPNVQLFATLTKSVALFAYHVESLPPSAVPYTSVNDAIAAGSHEWIAGPSREEVLEAMQRRSS